MANQAESGSEVNQNLSTTTDGPEIFANCRGYLPRRRSQIIASIKSGTLPEPARFGLKLRGYTISQIKSIQQRLLSVPR